VAWSKNRYTQHQKPGLRQGRNKHHPSGSQGRRPGLHPRTTTVGLLGTSGMESHSIQRPYLHTAQLASGTSPLGQALNLISMSDS
jgi:hypothetical protein